MQPRKQFTVLFLLLATILGSASRAQFKNTWTYRYPSTEITGTSDSTLAFRFDDDQDCYSLIRADVDQYVISKTSFPSTIAWRSHLFANAAAPFSDLTVDSDRNPIAVCSTANGSDYTAMLVKLDKDLGTIVWARDLGMLVPRAICSAGVHHVILVGTDSTIDDNSTSFITMCVDTVSGATLWSRTEPLTGPYLAAFLRPIPLTESAVVCLQQGNSYFKQQKLQAVSTSGAINWTTTIDSDTQFYRLMQDVQIAPDGSIRLLLVRSPWSGFQSSLRLARMDSVLGSIGPETTVFSNSGIGRTALGIDASNNSYVFYGYNSDGIVTKIDPAGTIQYERPITGIFNALGRPAKVSLLQVDNAVVDAFRDSSTTLVTRVNLATGQRLWTITRPIGSFNCRFNVDPAFEYLTYDSGVSVTERVFLLTGGTQSTISVPGGKLSVEGPSGAPAISEDGHIFALVRRPGIQTELLKITPNGATEWDVTISSTSATDPNRVFVPPGNQYVVVVSGRAATSGVESRPRVYVLSQEDGHLISETAYGSTSSYFHDAKMTQDGYVCILLDDGPFQNPVVIKFNPSTQSSVWRWDSPTGPMAQWLVLDEAGNSYVNYGEGGATHFLVCIDNSGHTVWTTSFSRPGWSTVQQVLVARYGSVFTLATYGQSSGGTFVEQTDVMRLDPANGNVLFNVSEDPTAPSILPGSALAHSDGSLTVAYPTAAPIALVTKNFDSGGNARWQHVTAIWQATLQPPVLFEDPIDNAVGIVFCDHINQIRTSKTWIATGKQTSCISLVNDAARYSPTPIIVKGNDLTLAYQSWWTGLDSVIKRFKFVVRR